MGRDGREYWYQLFELEGTWGLGLQGAQAEKSTKHIPSGLTENETANGEPAWVFSKSSANVNSVGIVFGGGSSQWEWRGISYSFACFWNTFSPTGLPCSVLK